MLYKFLIINQQKILELTERKTLDLAGSRPSSEKLKTGLPLFFNQLVAMLKVQEEASAKESLKNETKPSDGDPKAHSTVAIPQSVESYIETGTQDRSAEIEVAEVAGRHGKELQRLGYTLSHVVHAYGAMCQSITELAMENGATITATEFHDFNLCLDVGIAGAVTGYQAERNVQEKSREVEHLGFLAHELRNALTSSSVALQLIKRGTVGFSGGTAQILENGLKRIGYLVDRSLTEVRLRVDPKLHLEICDLTLMIDQIIVTSTVEATERQQTLGSRVDESLLVEADQQLLYSAISNLVQNAIKYTRKLGWIEVRGKRVGAEVIIEVEDQCGGLTNAATDIFEPFKQQNENRKGLGLGLTIAQRAVVLNHGKIDVVDLPGRGCIFKITLPLKSTRPSDE